MLSEFYTNSFKYLSHRFFFQVSPGAARDGHVLLSHIMRKKHKNSTFALHSAFLQYHLIVWSNKLLCRLEFWLHAYNTFYTSELHYHRFLVNMKWRSPALDWFSVVRPPPLQCQRTLWLRLRQPSGWDVHEYAECPEESNALHKTHSHGRFKQSKSTKRGQMLISSF